MQLSIRAREIQHLVEKQVKGTVLIRKDVEQCVVDNKVKTIMGRDLALLR